MRCTVRAFAWPSVNKSRRTGPSVVARSTHSSDLADVARPARGPRRSPEPSIRGGSRAAGGHRGRGAASRTRSSPVEPAIRRIAIPAGVRSATSAGARRSRRHRASAQRTTPATQVRGGPPVGATACGTGHRHSSDTTFRRTRPSSPRERVRGPRSRPRSAPENRLPVGTKTADSRRLTP